MKMRLIKLSLALALALAANLQAEPGLSEAGPKCYEECGGCCACLYMQGRICYEWACC
jgi:hypothetical protein